MIEVRRTLGGMTTGGGGAAAPGGVPSSEHHTEIGSVAAGRLVSAACSCGWSTVVSYARPTGEPVALRLARIRADLHEQHPEKTDGE